MTTKKKAQKKGYGVASTLGIAGAGTMAGAELTAMDHDRWAKQQRNSHEFWSSRAKTGGFTVGGTTAGGYDADPKLSPTEHEAKAAEYDKWSRARGTKYPYMTPRANKEAAERAYEHRKAGNPRFSQSRPGSSDTRSGYGSSRARSNPFDSEDFWRRAYDGARSQARGDSSGQDAYNASRARSAARSAERYAGVASKTRLIGHGVGGTLLAGGVALGVKNSLHNKKFDEAKHRRNRGKFAATGVKKSMDEVSKDYREELHRRANDGRFQAGAAGGAGAGLAALSVRSGNRQARGLRDQAFPHSHDAKMWRQSQGQHQAAAEKTAADAAGAKGRAKVKATKLSQQMRGEALKDGAKAFGAEQKAAPLLRNAQAASRSGKLSAGLALGAGAAGVAYGVHNHRKQSLINDLEQESTMEKNFDSAEEVFSKLERETKRGMKIGAAVGGVAGAGLTAAELGSNGYGAKGALLGGVVGGAAGAGLGAAQGAAYGAAEAHQRKTIETAVRSATRRSVKKNLEESSVTELFAKARGQEIEKGLIDSAGRLAGQVGNAGRRTGTAFAGAAGAASRTGATGFKSATTGVKAAGTSIGRQAKTAGTAGVKRFKAQTPGRQLIAAGSGGAAVGVGAGAWAQSRKN